VPYPGCGQESCPYEHGDETSASLKGGKFVEVDGCLCAGTVTAVHTILSWYPCLASFFIFISGRTADVLGFANK